MGLERLIKSVTSSCEKQPHAERLCAAGLLAQVLQHHAGAGGQDPRRRAARKDLLAAGVPLAARTRPSSKPERSRGVFTYIEQHIAKGLSRSGRREESRRLALAFYAMPKDEQARWAGDEMLQARKRSGCQDEVGLLDPDADYQSRIGGNLCGVSTRAQPMPVERFQETVARVTGVDVATCGMRQYVPKLRENFRGNTIFFGSDILTRETQVTVHVPCGMAHPGLCADKMGEVAFNEAFLLHRKLAAYFKTQKKGAYFRITAMPANLEVYVVLGDIHGGNTPSVSVVMCALVGDKLEFDVDAAGLVQPVQTSQLASMLLKRGGAVSVQACRCAVLHTTRGVDFVNTEGPTEIKDFKASHSKPTIDEKDPVGVSIANSFNKLFRPEVPRQAVRRSVACSSEKRPKAPRKVVVHSESGESSSSSAGTDASFSSGDAAADADAGGVVDAAVLSADDGDGHDVDEAEYVSLGSLNSSEKEAMAALDVDGDSEDLGADRGGADPKRRKRLTAWEVVDTRTGEVMGRIVWNENVGSLDAHCQCDKHVDRLDCAVNRTAKKRPLAFLIAWLECCHQFGDRASHFAARLGRGEDAQYLTHRRRSEIRALVEADPYWEEARQKERDPRPEEGLEPVALP